MTIREFIASGDSYTAHCNDCGHSRDLDMQEIGNVLGMDHGSLSPDIVPHIYCSKCKSKRIGLILSPGGNERRGWGGAHGLSYAKAKGV